jgi:hypothetical protein
VRTSANIPRIDLPRLAVLRRLLPTAVRTLRRTRRNLKLLPALVASSPNHCDELRGRIGRETDPARLRDLWITEIGPFFEATSDPIAMIRVQKRPRAMVGSADAEALTGQPVRCRWCPVGRRRCDRGATGDRRVALDV